MNKPSFPLITERCNVRSDSRARPGEGPRLRPPPALPEAAALFQRAAGSPTLRPGPQESCFPGPNHVEQIPGEEGDRARSSSSPREPGPAPLPGARALREPPSSLRAARRGRERLSMDEVQSDGGSPSGPGPQCWEFLS